MYPYLVREMNRAVERCKQVAESEKLLGFTDSADMYADMAREFSGLALWVMVYAGELGVSPD